MDRKIKFTGCPTKHDPHGFCLISLAKNLLECWDVIHWKGGIHSFVWSTKTFLYDIREPRYNQIKMGYQISKCLNIGQFYCLEIWYCCDLCIVSLAMIILEGWDISHFKDDILIKHAESSNPFLYKHKGSRNKSKTIRDIRFQDTKIVQYLNILRSDTPF